MAVVESLRPPRWKWNGGADPLDGKQPHAAWGVDLPATDMAGRRSGGSSASRSARRSLPARSVVAVIPLEEAQATVLAACPRLAAVELPLGAAIGRVLTGAVTAPENVPPFANSAVDGYAVQAADTSGAGDTPVELRVLAEVAAGASTDIEVVPGTAIRIMTGAPVPAGADAVVMVEDTANLVSSAPVSRETRETGAADVVRGETVRIGAEVEHGAGVRDAGSDVRQGDVLFGDGVEITPAVAGVLATVNALWLSVTPTPRVAVLATGDELVTDGRPLRAGEIRESNLTMLAAAVAATGAEVTAYGVVPDDEAVLEHTLRRAADESDAIVTSGGVSMGDYDVVKLVLGRIAEMHWMQVAIKPAKPFAFGLLTATDGRAVPVFGLPGNPVSSLVSFELFARPALRQMAGHRRLARPSVVAIADADLARRPDGKTHVMRVVHRFDGDDGRVHVVPVPAQGSHQLAATAAATALAFVPDGDTLPAGTEVATLLLA